MGASSYRKESDCDGGRKDEAVLEMSCPGCGKSWNDHNSTKALAHGSKNKVICLSQHIAACKGQSSAEEVKLLLFSDLFERKVATKAAKKRGQSAVAHEITEAQEEVATAIKKKKKLNSKKT